MPNSFFSYTSGVYRPTVAECQTAKSLKYGHEAAVIGYGVQDGLPYWLLKNSWGTNWGENGYFKLYRGDGSCSMGKPMSAAIISSPSPITTLPPSTTCPVGWVYFAKTNKCFKVMESYVSRRDLLKPGKSSHIVNL